ncbi:hypothetical protein [Cupriavidus basilensis]|uniref:hypothetical protein n=1 Tax=Cupriavidus basilensis TaxID=68895 RepID=UPI001300C806|nr:hypothetical protein [Cupriavidus basilensis]
MTRCAMAGGRHGQHEQEDGGAAWPAGVPAQDLQRQQGVLCDEEGRHEASMR